VDPEKPDLELNSVSVELDLFEQLGLEITGEAKTTARINISSDTGESYFRSIYIPNSGVYQTNNLLGKQMSCGGITYTVKVTLTDRAGNISQESTQTIKTKDCPVCGGSGSGLFAHPTNFAGKLTSNYPVRAIQSNPNGPHAGVDFGIPNGTPIYASYDGIVKRANHVYPNKPNTALGWGNVVILEHNVEGIKHQTIYAHLNTQKVVNEGDEVKRGQVIGYSGNSGFSTGPHLHYQIEKEGASLAPELSDGIIRWNMQYPVDPKGYLPPLETDLTPEQQAYLCPDTEGVDLGDGGSDGDDIDFGNLVTDLEGEELEVNIPSDSILGEELMNELLELMKKDATKYFDYIYEPIERINSDCNGGDLLCYLHYADQSAYRAFELIQEWFNGFFEGVGQWFIDLWNLISAPFKAVWSFITKIPTYIFNPGKIIDDFKASLQPVIDIFNKLTDEETRKAMIAGAIDEIRALLNKTAPEKARFEGQVLGYLAPEIAIAVFTAGGSLGAKIGQYTAQISTKIINLLKGINIARGFIGKTITIAANTLAKIVKVGSKIIIQITDAIEIARKAQDEAFEAFLKLLKFDKAKDVVKRFRSVITFCKSNIKSFAFRSPVDNSKFSISDLFKPVGVEASFGKAQVCYLLDFPDSHWRERHFDITDIQLQNRAKGIKQTVNGKEVKALFPGQTASKFTIPEGEVNNLITDKLRTAKGKDFVNSLEDLKPDERKDIVFDLDKSIGYGYTVPKGSTSLNKVTNMNKIKIVFAKNSNDELFILTSHPYLPK
jgi:hypothetical protein